MRPGKSEALQQPYDPTRIESRWYSFWEQRGVFEPRPGGKERFVIAIPPRGSDAPPAEGATDCRARHLQAGG